MATTFRAWYLDLVKKYGVNAKPGISSALSRVDANADPTQNQEVSVKAVDELRKYDSDLKTQISKETDREAKLNLSKLGYDIRKLLQEIQDYAVQAVKEIPKTYFGYDYRKAVAKYHMTMKPRLIRSLNSIDINRDYGKVNDFCTLVLNEFKKYNTELRNQIRAEEEREAKLRLSQFSFVLRKLQQAILKFQKQYGTGT